MANIYLDIPLAIENGGLFVSNGHGRHPKRVLHSFELIFVYSGTLSIGEQQQHYQLQAGQYLLLYPNLEHYGIRDYPSDLQFYWVHFNLSRHSKRSISQDFIQLPKFGSMDDPDKINSLFNLLLHEQTLSHEKSVLNMLLLLIIQMLGEQSETTELTRSVNLAYRARSVIHQHYLAAITPSFVAQQLQCNVDYLGRVYKQTFKMTLTDAIHQQKIQIAKQMLTETNHPVKSIARGVGYTDPGYFRRVFVKEVKLTPSAYRKLYGLRIVNSR